MLRGVSHGVYAQVRLGAVCAAESATACGFVFISLVAIMVGMAAGLLPMVVGLFGSVISPSVGSTIDPGLDA